MTDTFVLWALCYTVLLVAARSTRPDSIVRHGVMVWDGRL